MSLVERLSASLRALDVPVGAPLAVACSGGADSVALLRLLALDRSPVYAFHVDHRLRPDSSLDAAFVRDLAGELATPFDVEQVTVAATGSVEAAARNARYDALKRMARRNGVDFVLTAHTTDDQAETVLLRAMRGGALDAIAPRRGIFVRPLLGVRGEELRDWLRKHDFAWREDATNVDVRFERNWVRHVLLPQMRERRLGVDLALGAIADRAREDRIALDAIAADVFSRAHVDDVGVLLPSEIDAAPAAVARRVFRCALRHFGVEPSAAALAVTRAGRASIGGVEVWRSPSGLAFTRPIVPEPVPLPAAGIVTDDVRGLRVRVGPSDVPSWRWRCAASAGPLVLRARRDGDRIGTKKVQDILVDAKVPRPLRDRIGIVACDAGAIAVVGHAPRRQSTSSDIVIDVELISRSWSRELLWKR